MKPPEHHFVDEYGQREVRRMWLGSEVEDDNGREIFEGDIVQYVGDDFFGVALKGSTSIVTFDHGGFRAFAMSLVNFNDGGLEVVGHIAEETA